MSSTPRKNAVEIVADAFDLPPESRDAFVRESCGDDPDLLEKVKSLLSVATEADRELPTEWVSQLAAREFLALAEPEVGQQAGSYRLIRVLGTGGMGKVYLAERSDSEFEKLVAIKVVRTGLGGPELEKRFRTERQVLASLQHPGIAYLLDGGVLENGLPYLVMEFVDGKPIDLFCDEAMLEIKERVALMSEVCEAVSHAHRNLVIHRDLKPSNILVTPDGKPKLLDFGIAKVLDVTEDSRATRTQHRMLTPRYASPEQLRGQADATSTDVYSLGVILYELLTGSSPHPTEGKEPGALEEAILGKEPTGPSRRIQEQGPRNDDLARAAGLRGASVRGLEQSLRGDLDAITLQALERNASDRYTSASELGDDLRRYLAGQPIHARPDTALYRMTKFVRRNWILVGSVLAVLLTLVIGLAVTFQLLQTANSEKARAEWLAYARSLAAAESAIREGQTRAASEYLISAPPALRGWEWYHLAGRVDRSEISIQGHDDFIHEVEFDPHGSTFASVSRDRTAAIWEAETGQLLFRTSEQRSEIQELSFHPRERLLAIGCNHGSVLVLEIATGDTLIAWDTDDRWVQGLDFSPSGDLLAAGFQSGRIKVWRFPEGSEVASWNGHGGTIQALEFHPDGSYFATASWDKTARFWDPYTGVQRGELKGHEKPLSSLAFDRDGTEILTGSRGGTASRWNTATGKRLMSFFGHEGFVNEVAFLDSVTAISSGHDRSVLTWNTRNSKVVRSMQGHETAVQAMSVGPRGDRIVTGDSDGNIRVWSARSTDILTFDRFEASWLFDSIVDTELGWVVCASSQPGVHVLDLESGRKIYELSAGPEGDPFRVDLSPDRSRLIGGHGGGWMTIWSTSTGELVRAIKAHESENRSVEYSPTGDRIVSCSRDRKIKTWSSEGDSLATLEGHRGTVFRARFHPDGRMVASCSGDSTVRLWDTETGSQLAVMTGHGHSVRDVAFHPSGKLLASASADGSVRLWSVPDGDPAGVVLQEDTAMFAVAFNSTGDRLAVGCGDHTIRICEVADPRQIMSLYGHSGIVASLRYTHGDSILVSAARDGSSRIWDARSQLPPSR